VTVMPPGAVIIGSNDMCACQAMIIPGRVLSVQGPNTFFVTEIRAPGIQPTDCRIYHENSNFERFIFAGRV
jgi:hypothetical protein